MLVNSFNSKKTHGTTLNPKLPFHLQTKVVEIFWRTVKFNLTLNMTWFGIGDVFMVIPNGVWYFFYIATG